MTMGHSVLPFQSISYLFHVGVASLHVNECVSTDKYVRGITLGDTTCINQTHEQKTASNL